MVGLLLEVELEEKEEEEEEKEAETGRSMRGDKMG